jgi:hypothetical protein
MGSIVRNLTYALISLLFASRTYAGDHAGNPADRTTCVVNSLRTALSKEPQVGGRENYHRLFFEEPRAASIYRSNLGFIPNWSAVERATTSYEGSPKDTAAAGELLSELWDSAGVEYRVALSYTSENGDRTDISGRIAQIKYEERGGRYRAKSVHINLWGVDNFFRPL